MKRYLCLLAIPAFLGAQDGAGLSPAWEVNKRLDALVASSKRLAPLAGEIKVSDWREAPSAYAEQHTSVRNEIGYLERTVGDLVQNPEKMTKTLEAYFRLQAIESLLDSLSQGVRQYQNPALADLIQGVIAENTSHRGWLRGYLVELTASKEDELRVIGQEAQRCRSEMLRQPKISPPKRAAALAPPERKPKD